MKKSLMTLKNLVPIYGVLYFVLIVLDLIRVLMPFRFYLEVPLKLFISLSCLFFVFFEDVHKPKEKFSFSDRFLLKLAFVFIFLGDVFLAVLSSVFMKEIFFKIGLAFFTLVNLVFILRHGLRLLSLSFSEVSLKKILVFLGLALFVFFLSAFTRSALVGVLSPKLINPLTFYLILVSISFLITVLLALFHLYKRAFYLAVGYGLFYLSDLFIGLSLLKQGFSFMIWFLYAPAILLIAYSGSLLFESVE